jgi:hypothetical protein
MPFAEVKRLTEGVAERTITAVTDGLCTACGEEVRDRTVVPVQGTSPQLRRFGDKTIISGGIAS